MREAWMVMAVTVIGCQGSAATVDGGGGDAGAALPMDASPDAPPPPAPGPLWMACAPAVQGSCPAGYECLGLHTAPIDAYGTCTFTCAGSSGPSCALNGGTCSCPLAGGGQPGDCSVENDAGEVTVCAPAGDAGVPGDNSADSAAFEDDDAGDSGAADAGAG